MNVQPLVMIWQTDGSQRLAEWMRKLGVNARAVTSVGSLAEKCSGDTPCCVVCDLTDFDELNESLGEFRTPPVVVAVTSQANSAPIVRALRGGATTVLEQTCSSDELREQIQIALANWSDAVGRHNFEQRLKTLTPQERTVLDHMMAGQSNKEIAHHVGVSLRTIEARRHNIFAKTDTKSFAELIARCATSKLVPLQPLRVHVNNETAA